MSAIGLNRRKCTKPILGLEEASGRTGCKPVRTPEEGSEGTKSEEDEGSEHGVLSLMVSEDEKEADGRSCV